MMTQSRFQEIFYEVLEEIYQNSEPKASFKDLMRDSPRDDSGKILIPFESYTCPMEVIDVAIERSIKKYRLREPWISSLKTNVYLGPSLKSV